MIAYLVTGTNNCSAATACVELTRVTIRALGDAVQRKNTLRIVSLELHIASYGVGIYVVATGERNLLVDNSCRHRPALLLLLLLLYFSRHHLLHCCSKGRLAAQRKSLCFHCSQHIDEAVVAPTIDMQRVGAGYALCRKPGEQKHGSRHDRTIIERIGGIFSLVKNNTNRRRVVD